MILILNKNGSDTLHRQICRQLREQILKGTLPAGYKLPSTRTLVQEYSLSRNVFLAAFEQLLAEGYLVSRKGMGTFVSEKIDLSLVREERRMPPVRAAGKSETGMYDFSIGMPDLGMIPLVEWGRCLRKAVSDLKPGELGYSDRSGTIRLQEALRNHLLVSRGMTFEKEQVFICAGSYQALLLAIQSVVTASIRKKVVIENPCYRLLAEGISRAEGELIPVTTDRHGIDPALIPDDPEISLVSTTPSHLFPAGSVYPIHRRLELCRLAEERDFYIIENEFDGDLRLKGSPVPSMQTLSRDRIFHAGTFSQILYPALRVGYLIGPPHLVNQVKECFTRMGYGVPVSVQNGLAQYMEEGLLHRHYRKMKRLYLEKQDTLLKILDEEFADGITINGQDTGTYVTVSFMGIRFSDRNAKILEEAGIRADYEYRHLWPHTAGQSAPGMLLGFGNLSQQQIRAGISRLKKVLTAPGLT